MSKVNKKALKWMEKYLRYTDYIGAAQLYLKDNFFLEKVLLFRSRTKEGGQMFQEKNLDLDTGGE